MAGQALIRDRPSAPKFCAAEPRWGAEGPSTSCSVFTRRREFWRHWCPRGRRPHSYSGLNSVEIVDGGRNRGSMAGWHHRMMLGPRAHGSPSWLHAGAGRQQSGIRAACWRGRDLSAPATCSRACYLICSTVFRAHGQWLLRRAHMAISARAGCGNAGIKPSWGTMAQPYIDAPERWPDGAEGRGTSPVEIMC